MTDLTPTATSMKLKFPEFRSVDDAVIEMAIEEARATVGSNWIESSRTLARMYLAAHLIAAGQAATEGGAGQTIASESIGGEISITYRNDSSPTATADDFNTSSYGRRYLDILGGNFAGARIV